MITIDEKYRYGDFVNYSIIEQGDIFYKRKEGVVIGMKFVQHALIDNDGNDVCYCFQERFQTFGRIY